MKNSSTARRPFGITVIALILFVQALFEIVNIVLHFLGYEQTHTIFASMSGGILSIIVVIYLLVDGDVRRAFRTGIQSMQRWHALNSSICVLTSDNHRAVNGMIRPKAALLC